MSDGLRACHFDEAVHELPTAAGKIFTIPPLAAPAGTSA